MAQAARGELVFPTSVNAALKLQLALANPTCHIEEAIKLVLSEPLLAARIVAMGNSALFHRAGNDPVTSARAAVMRMGQRNLYSLVVALVVRQFGSKISDPAVRKKAEQLWLHTLHVAALAYVIARRVTCVDADTALFAGIVHEIGSFYLLSRADEFPGLLDDDPEHWMEPAEEIIAREVMKRLLIPDLVSTAIEALRDGMLGLPPESLLDTLLLAKQLAPVASPMSRQAPTPMAQTDSVIDFVIDSDTLADVMDEAAQQVASMRSALLV